jgi:hypothetical protein
MKIKLVAISVLSLGVLSPVAFAQQKNCPEVPIQERNRDFIFCLPGMDSNFEISRSSRGDNDPFNQQPDTAGDTDAGETLRSGSTDN